jgi:site-specific recombinase XerD
MWRSGLRVGEALTLRMKDIDLDGATITIQHGKGDKRRVVGMDSGTAAIVATWMSNRRELPHQRTGPMLSTLGGKPLDPSYVRHLLPRLARRAGIEKRAHAHALRHAFAIELDREGAPISVIRDLLGHSSVAVTDHYLRRVSGGHTTYYARNRHWHPDHTVVRSEGAG